jgi:hypothetical protein
LAIRTSALRLRNGATRSARPIRLLSAPCLGPPASTLTIARAREQAAATPTTSLPSRNATSRRLVAGETAGSSPKRQPARGFCIRRNRAFVAESAVCFLDPRTLCRQQAAQRVEAEVVDDLRLGLQEGAAAVTAAFPRSGSGRRHEQDDCFGNDSAVSAPRLPGVRRASAPVPEQEPGAAASTLPRLLLLGGCDRRLGADPSQRSALRRCSREAARRVRDPAEPCSSASDCPAAASALLPAGLATTNE